MRYELSTEVLSGSFVKGHFLIHTMKEKQKYMRKCSLESDLVLNLWPTLFFSVHSMTKREKKKSIVKCSMIPFPSYPLLLPPDTWHVSLQLAYQTTSIKDSFPFLIAFGIRNCLSVLRPGSI